MSRSSVQNFCFPRTDTVAIACVIHADGNQVLLGRKREFPKGVYSCLAGFIDCGETLVGGWPVDG